MTGLEVLTIDDVVTDSPHTNLLASVISENANTVGECVKQLRDGLQAVSRCEEHLSLAYKELSALLRAFANQESTFCPDEEIRQLGFQFSSILDELGSMHQCHSNELQDGLIYKLQNFISDVFEKLSSESLEVETCRKLSRQAFQNYMRLPKRCPSKVRQSSVLEVTSTRRKFACAASRYYGHLNEAEQIRYLAPLISIRTFITQKKNHVQTAHDLFSQGIVDSFVAVAEESLHKYESSFNNVKRKSLANIGSIEHKSLSYFCPEPWILNATPNQACISKTCPREPNRRLLTKSGSLLMRTRVNLIWRWLEVYCLIQNGNFMYQQRGDIASSLLFDLNQKGVYAEATDADDRRHVFLIASPTERKTILLQAESETERDEWISTIMNVIFHTNHTDDMPVEEYSRTLHHTEKTDTTTPQVADENLRDCANPVEHDLTYIDWFSNHLPQIHFDLNPIPELSILLDTELQVFCEENVEKQYNNPPYATNNDNNSEAIIHDTNSVDTDENNHPNGKANNASHTTTGSCSNPCKFVYVDKLSNSFPCHFLGVVELPMDHFPQDQFNDIFTYVLSCRSASELPSPISCRILITKNNVWILATKEHDSEQYQKPDILLKIPFHAIRSWHNHPDNPKLGCLVVQGRLNDVMKFVNSNGCIGFTFESDVSQMIIECILAAEFNRLDTLQDEKDQSERNILTSNIAQISNSMFCDNNEALHPPIQEVCLHTSEEIIPDE
ncbi:hypothetical protein MN116_007487 [Schistosoma mekongi]|uniref:PH domain-containing protein n=1 Tax=Schistosoma mekongi TaxID=38744 RepID=A0AAE1Z7K2_SCHME|nr:hypothetical protein MN116_007487 [Schistosoma mekongi]